jgi:hypothetical protein
MTKLPNLDKLVVEEAKIKAYLLSETNSDGKYDFYIAFGFTPERWETLKTARIRHAITHDVKQTLETPHGIKYIIEGELQAPDGRTPQVRAVWIVDTGKDAPRLVTAYPLKGE